MKELHNFRRYKGINILNDQVVAEHVFDALERQKAELAQKITHIQLHTASKIQDANDAFTGAMSHIENLRDFVAPDNQNAILGRVNTKHGEIAEHIEVEITNGWQTLKRLHKIADITNVGRTAPEDYTLGGIPVQSKFINGPRACLDHVLEHMKKYPDFAKDASQYGYPGKEGFYHIPKDHYETIKKICNGETTEFSTKTINTCKRLINDIEIRSGRKFEDVIRPGISKYKDVQLGVVDKTIDNHAENFNEYHRKEIKEIQKDARKQRSEAQHITDPSWKEAAKGAAVGAIIGGVTSAGIQVYSKINDGKSLGDFTQEDWKEVGFDFAKGAGKGGISGIGIYGLTKLGNFSAPFAGAMVSSAIGITSLTFDYRAGKINENDFSTAANALSIETSLAAIGAAIGQAVIPLPVLGSIIGSVSAKAALEISKYLLGESEKKLIKKMEVEYQSLMRQLDKECKDTIEQINLYFDKLHGFVSAALSPDAACRAYGSIELCRFLGIGESEIIKNHDELDVFMLA